MYRFHYLSLFFLILFLNSCSTITREDCKKDMYNMGLSQGRKGLNNLSDDIRKVCIRGDQSVDLLAYDKGFTIGWSEYCTPIHGYENGLKGDLYKSFCPDNKEKLFHEKFLIGKKVTDKKDQLQDLDDKMNDLAMSNEHDLQARDELNKIKDLHRAISREIQALEQAGMSPVHIDL